MRSNSPHPSSALPRTPFPACGGGLGCWRCRGLSSRVDEGRGARDFAGGSDGPGQGAEEFGEAGAADPGERQDRRAGPRGAGERPTFLLHRFRIDRVDLVEADDLRLGGEAVTVTGKLVPDRAVGADDILLGAVNQMQDHRAALDMAEKAGAETGPLAGALDQIGRR